VHILRNRWRLAITAAAAALPLALLGAGLSGTASATPKPALPPIKHVWVIELENEGFNQSFGNPSADPYLGQDAAEHGSTGQKLLRDRTR
jgi:phosphatidylinositol-3-phosphatase